VTSKPSTKPFTKAKSEIPTIQFPCYNATLPGRVEREMKLAGYTSRPKYLNALLEKVLSLFPASASGSCLDALVNLVQLFESLPVERIRELAPTQNRNFDQMFKHLLEISLNHYAQNPSQSNITGEVGLVSNLINLPGKADYKDRTDATGRERVRKRALRN
jgi:hypothetical protein